MRISLLCSDEKHPVNKCLDEWIIKQQDFHKIELVRNRCELSGGDILFLISCAEIISANDRAGYKTTLVLHASDLPKGSGWNPHIWQIIEGAQEITLCLLEAEDLVDSGRIWQKVTISIPQHALWDEINKYIFNAEMELLDFAINQYNYISPSEQNSKITRTFYPRRTPLDSKIDPTQSIESQFDLIRVCDPHRFPAFFQLHGKKYKLILENIDE